MGGGKFLKKWFHNHGITLSPIRPHPAINGVPPASVIYPTVNPPTNRTSDPTLDEFDSSDTQRLDNRSPQFQAIIFIVLIWLLFFRHKQKR